MKSFVINLKRRSDRLIQFQSQGIDAEVYEGIDGNKLPNIPYYQAGRSAWACLRSHMNIFEISWTKGYNEIAIFEDDAIFCAGYTQKLREFMEHCPPWEMLAIGGQNMTNPIQINKWVCKSTHVGRTHALIWNMQSRFSRSFYTECQAYESHLDWKLGEMCREYACFQPINFLVGQRQSQSDIVGRMQEERWWTKEEDRILTKDELTKRFGRAFGDRECEIYNGINCPLAYRDKMRRIWERA